MQTKSRYVQYTTDEEGKGDLLGLVLANQPGLDIRGNGTLQDPLRVVIESGYALIATRQACDE